MARNVITVSSTTSHRDAVELMRKHRIRRLPVVDNGELVGIVVEKDLLSAQPSQATTLSIYEIYTLLDKLTLSKIMKSPVITVGPDCPVEDAAKIMISNKIGCLPVMENGQVVGLITETDIFRILVEVLGGGEAGLNFTVRVADQPGKLAELAAAVTRSGGNIVSIYTFRAPNAEKHLRDVTVKEMGADPQSLQTNITTMGGEIVHIQPGMKYEPTLVG
jgi:acetoin utilization protein AcuB